MRHGNEVDSFQPMSLDGYSDPTYEAWKHEILTKLKDRILNSDPTYEAWKHEILTKLTDRILNSDPTYEAWKLFRPIPENIHCYLLRSYL